MSLFHLSDSCGMFLAGTCNMFQNIYYKLLKIVFIISDLMGSEDQCWNKENIKTATWSYSALKIQRNRALLKQSFTGMFCSVDKE